MRTTGVEHILHRLGRGGKKSRVLKILNFDPKNKILKTFLAAPFIDLTFSVFLYI